MDFLSKFKLEKLFLVQLLDCKTKYGIFLILSQAYISTGDSIPPCATDDVATAQVVVAAGNTLYVHSSPSTSSPTLYSLANGAVVDVTCTTTGDTISGSQGTTNEWYSLFLSAVCVCVCVLI